MTAGDRIAQTILDQLGGTGRLAAFLGADQFVAMESGLKFRFKGSPKANLVLIRLSHRDTYTVEFFKVRGLDYKPVALVEDVYADQLRHVFEQFTGLLLGL